VVNHCGHLYREGGEAMNLEKLIFNLIGVLLFIAGYVIGYVSHVCP
jgi:hypothetical protein